MKRQIQTTGVRKYFGRDLIDLQAEPFSILDAFLGYAGACIVKGCEVTKNADNTFNVSAGLVALEAVDHGRRGDENTRRVMVMPFDGAQNTAMPLYLTTTEEIITRQYKDGKIKPVAYNYKAQASAVQPAEGTSFLRIAETSRPIWLEVVQDALHRLVTDTQIKQWDAKPTATELEKYVKKVGATVDNELTMTRTQNGARFLWRIVQGSDHGNNTLELIGKSAKGSETTLFSTQFYGSDPADEETGLTYFNRTVFAIAGIFASVIQAVDITAETVSARLVGVAEKAEMDANGDVIPDTYAKKKDIPTELPANGGNADSVGSKPVDRIMVDSMNSDLKPDEVPGHVYGFGYSRNGWPTNGTYICFGSPDVTGYLVQIQTNYLNGAEIWTRSQINDNSAGWGAWKRFTTVDDLAGYMPHQYTTPEGYTYYLGDDGVGGYWEIAKDGQTIAQLRINKDKTVTYYDGQGERKRLVVADELPTDATREKSGLLSSADKIALDDITNVAGKPVIFAEVTAIPSSNGDCTIKSRTAAGVTVSISRTVTGFFINHNLGTEDYFVVITPHDRNFNYYTGKSTNLVSLSTSTAWPFNVDTPCWVRFSVAIFKYK